MRISRTFYAHWGDRMRPGLSYAHDPNGNVLTLDVSARHDKPRFRYGAKNIAEFYCLNSKCIVVLHYLGDNVFDISIFYYDFVEVYYPVLNGSVEPPWSVVKSNFSRTVKLKLDPTQVFLL